MTASFLEKKHQKNGGGTPSEAHSSCLTLWSAFLINFAAKHLWEARDVTEDGKLSDDDDGLEDPLDMEWEGSDSPGDDKTNSEHQARDEPSEQRLSDEWNTSQHIQHSPEPWTMVPSTTTPKPIH
jgi:hypothetical protein